jgi:DNA-directed RNA polymerase specialized sigma24 family protein
MFNNTKKGNDMLQNEDVQKKAFTTMATARGVAVAARRPCLMRSAANDAYYRAAINAAKTRTYRAAVSAGLSPADREDLYQEILLDLLERETQFNPARGSAGTFTGLVSEHRTAEFLNARKADRERLSFAAGEDFDFLVVGMDRARQGIDLIQDAANDEDVTPNRSNLLDDTSPWWGGDDDLFSNSNTLHDLELALAHMSEEQTELFCLLASHQDLPAAAKVSGMSSATFYRRAADLQMHLRMFGIRTAA